MASLFIFTHRSKTGSTKPSKNIEKYSMKRSNVSRESAIICRFCWLMKSLRQLQVKFISAKNKLVLENTVHISKVQLLPIYAASSMSSSIFYLKFPQKLTKLPLVFLILISKIKLGNNLIVSTLSTSRSLTYSDVNVFQRKAKSSFCCKDSMIKAMILKILFRLSELKTDSVLALVTFSLMHRLTRVSWLRFSLGSLVILKKNKSCLISTSTFCMSWKGQSLVQSLKMQEYGQT